jgi:hypothetical protein
MAIVRVGNRVLPPPPIPAAGPRRLPQRVIRLRNERYKVVLSDAKNDILTRTADG